MRVLPTLLRRLTLAGRSLGQSRSFSDPTTVKKPHKPYVSEASVGLMGGVMDDPEMHTYDTDYKSSEHMPHWVYREAYPESGWLDKTMTHIMSAMFIYWIVYHLYYHTGHLVGEFYMPKLDEFTDAELGIMPDDAEDPEYWGDHDHPKKL